MRSLINNAASIYSMTGALSLLITLVGQALTGGVRTEPSDGGPLSPWSAVFLLIWLLCVAYTGLRQIMKDI